MTLTNNLDQYVSDEIIIRQQLVNQLTSMGVTATTSETINELIEKVKTITLIGTTTTMSLTTTSCHYGASITVTGTLDDANSNPLKTKKLYLYAGERQVAEAVTNDNGLATFTYVVDEVGSLSLKVKYLGSNNYTTSESTSNALTVSKADTVITLTADPSTVPTGESTTLTVTLKDEWGNDLVGEAVEILSGTDVLYNGITDKNGIFTKEWSPQSTATLTAEYSGSSENTSITSTNLIVTVKDFLFAPTLKGNETWYNIRNTCSSGGGVGTNNGSGTGRLDKWDNTGNWKLTVTAKIYGNNTAIGLIPSTITSRDNTWLQLGTMNGEYRSIYTNNSSVGTTTYSGSYFTNYNNWVTVNLIKNGSNLTISYNGTTMETVSVSWLNTVPYMSFLLDTWSNNKVEIKNLTVETV